MVNYSNAARVWWRFLIFYIVCFSCLAIYPSGASAERTALVIGNSAYKKSPLANPGNDAEDMAQNLKTCGFEVIISINANRRQIQKDIRQFGKLLIKKKGVGLFFYAGHGIQVDGKNYIVPIGANFYGLDEVEYECVRMSMVLKKMEVARNSFNIIILDACRDNPFLKSRGGTRGLAQMRGPDGSIIEFATAPGSVAMDGSGRNGLYTSQLLTYMMEPGVAIEQVLKNVKAAVKKKSSARQIPWTHTSFTGNFYFIPPDRSIAVVKKSYFNQMKQAPGIEPIKKPAAVHPPKPPPVLIFKEMGIMIQQGQSNERLSWKNAKKYCQELGLKGFKDWRLPTKDELQKMIEKYYYSQSKSVTGKLFVNVSKFPSMTSLVHPTFWTNTIKSKSYAYCVSFSEGESRISNKKSNYYVKAVRTFK